MLKRSEPRVRYARSLSGHRCQRDLFSAALWLLWQIDRRYLKQQHIAMDTPSATLAGLPKRLQENFVVSIITKNRFQSVATVHHVIQRPPYSTRSFLGI